MGRASSGIGLMCRRELGLKNTKERLKQAYGVAYSVELLSRSEGGTVVRCRFPFRRFNAKQESSFFDWLQFQYAA